MRTNQLFNDRELQRVLWACFDYWNAEELPFQERSVCYAWAARRYQSRFGTTFHKSRLQELEQLGLLSKDDTSRRGNRRYYKINDPTKVAELLKSANLD